MTSLLLRELDRGLRKLPALPVAAARVMELHAEGVIDVEAYAGAIRADERLCASVIRMSNASVFGLGQRVEGIREACLQLGIHGLHSVVAGCAVMTRFPAGEPASGEFDRHAFWEHCAATAALAATIADQIGADCETAYTAGLLHDLGRIVLDVHFPRQFKAILRYRDRHDVLIRDAEAGVLGFDHCIIGERVARRWDLPDTIVEAIAEHHRPEKGGFLSPQPVIVHVADILARGLEVGNPGDHAMPLLSESALRYLGLNWSQLRRTLQTADGHLVESRALVLDLLQWCDGGSEGRAESH